MSLTMEPFHRNDLVLSIMFVLLSFKDSYRKHKIVDTNFDWMHQLLLLKSRSSELKWFNIPMQRQKHLCMLLSSHHLLHLLVRLFGSV